MKDALFSSASIEWETPHALFEKLNQKFHFTLDVCATPQNAKCSRFFTLEQDGLAKSWVGERCYMNPPYGRQIGLWVKKAHEESHHALVIGLLPARTDTKWWQNYVLNKADIHFLPGRLKFGNATSGAPFPSVLAIWWRLSF